MAPPPPSDWLAPLATSTAFADLDPAVLADLAAALEPLRLEGGAPLVRQGEAADRLFVIVEGVLSIGVERPGQAEQRLGRLGPGDVVGEVALLAGGTRTATVRAEGPVLVGALTRQRLDELGARRPQVVAALLAMGTRRLRRSQLAAYLEGLLGSLEPELLDELAGRVSWLHLRGGETLYAPGDPGDAAYLVLSGRLRVLADGAAGRARVLHEVGPGESLGETALLAPAPRHTTVVAVRDAELAGLGAETVRWLVEHHPALALRLVAAVGERLERATTMPLPAAPPVAERPLTFALLALGGRVDARAFATRLASALEGAGSVLCLGSEDAGPVVPGGVEALRSPAADIAPADDDPAGLRLHHWLDDREAAHRFVLYVGDPTWSRWTERCLRQADQVLLLADAAADPARDTFAARLGESRGPGAPSTSLVLFHAADVARPVGTARWLATHRVDRHLHLRGDHEEDLARAARLLTGRAVTLVLGGGGARGLAHIGVWRALAEAGVPIDMVGGTSMGAVVGAAFASGQGADEVVERSARFTSGLLDPTLPLVSVLAGRRIGRALEGLFGELAIEDLWLPFFCVSTNLTRAERVVHRTGNVFRAVRASASLPGILPPVYEAGDLLVDGGLLDNVPVDVMRELNGGGRIIAVDVSPAVEMRVGAPFAPELSGWQVLRQRLMPGRGRRSQRVPGIMEVLNRTVMVPSVHLRTSQGAAHAADLYLQPPVGRWGLFDFEALAAISQLGYDATREPIRAWWALQPR